MNRIVKAYEAVDRTLMSGANALVRGWNWTTGETKAELANKIMSLAAVFHGVGAFTFDAVIGCLGTSASIFATHLVQRDYAEIERKETKATEARCLDSEVVNAKDALKYIAPPLIAGCSAGPASLGYFQEDNKEKLGYFLIGTSYALVGASCYVMRADSLPPRRNCVERGIGWLADKARQYQSQPAQPAYQFVQRI